MIVFHIDVNNAFLSWESVERLKNPEQYEIAELRNIPAAIGGSRKERHGIILAKSTPAKAYGIHTAETINSALKKCPDLVIVPPRMEVYREYSKKLMQLLTNYSDTIEQFSIDEAFIDMTGTELLFGTPMEAAAALGKTIRETLGFTVNIGVSSNKVLAKMASDFEKPDKIHSLFPEEIKEKMWPLPVGELFLTGKSARRHLNNLGIRTIGDLAKSNPSVIKAHLGKHGETLYNYANGIDTSPITKVAAEAKGYGNSTTLPRDVTDSVEAKKYLLSLCDSVASRMRKNNVAAMVAAVSIKDFTFHTMSHQCTLVSPTNVTAELYHHICLLFDECWDGQPIRLLGVSATQITETGARQMNLLDGEKFIKQEKLDSAIDNIRDRFGENSITRASFLDKNK